jgi:hypothetical protein
VRLQGSFAGFASADPVALLDWKDKHLAVPHVAGSGMCQDCVNHCLDITVGNCALDLDKYGVLKKYNVELIGASKDAIEKAEDRKLFDIAMRKIGLECPKAAIAENMQEALEI